jgi:hypothetical protein
MEKDPQGSFFFLAPCVRQSFRNRKRQDRQRKGQARAGRSHGAFPRSTSSSSHRLIAIERGEGGFELQLK